MVEASATPVKVSPPVMVSLAAYNRDSNDSQLSSSESNTIKINPVNRSSNYEYPNYENPYYGQTKPPPVVTAKDILAQRDVSRVVSSPPESTIKPSYVPAAAKTEDVSSSARDIFPANFGISHPDTFSAGTNAFRTETSQTISELKQAKAAGVTNIDIYDKNGNKIGSTNPQDVVRARYDILKASSKSGGPVSFKYDITNTNNISGITTTQTTYTQSDKIKQGIGGFLAPAAYLGLSLLAGGAKLTGQTILGIKPSTEEVDINTMIEKRFGTAAAYPFETLIGQGSISEKAPTLIGAGAFYGLGLVSGRGASKAKEPVYGKPTIIQRLQSIVTKTSQSKVGSADIGLSLNKATNEFERAKLFNEQASLLTKPGTVKTNTPISSAPKPIPKNNDVLYHGSNMKPEEILNKEIISTSKSLDISTAFGRKTYEININKSAKTLNLKDVPQEIQNIHKQSPTEYDKTLLKFAKENNIDVIKGDPFYGEYETTIFNSKAITKITEISSEKESFLDFARRTRENGENNPPQKPTPIPGGEGSRFTSTKINLGTGIGRLIPKGGEGSTISDVTKPSPPPPKPSGKPKEVLMKGGLVQLLKETQETKNLFKSHPISLGKSKVNILTKEKSLIKSQGKQTQGQIQTQKYLDQLYSLKAKSKLRIDEATGQGYYQTSKQNTKSSLLQSFKTSTKQQTKTKFSFTTKQNQAQTHSFDIPTSQQTTHTFPNPTTNRTTPPPPKINPPPPKPPNITENPPPKEPPILLFDNKKKLKEKKAKNKNLADFLGNVSENSIVGIYKKRADITYGLGNIAKLTGSDKAKYQKGAKLITSKRTSLQSKSRPKKSKDKYKMLSSKGKSYRL